MRSVIHGGARPVNDGTPASERRPWMATMRRGVPEVRQVTQRNKAFEGCARPSGIDYPPIKRLIGLWVATERGAEEEWRMARDYTPKRAKAGAPAPVMLRCKACAGRFETTHPTATATCPACGESWRIRWFAPDSGMIIAPMDWKDYQMRARGEAAGRSGDE